jgi:hypothetical protein
VGLDGFKWIWADLTGFAQVREDLEILGLRPQATNPLRKQWGQESWSSQTELSVKKTIRSRELIKPDRTVCKKNNTIERANQARQNGVWEG